MGKKLRVYELARELNLDNSEVIWELQHMGVPVTSHSNTVEDRLADQLRRKVQAELAEGAAARAVAIAESEDAVAESAALEPVEAPAPEPPAEAPEEAPPVPPPAPVVPRVEARPEPEAEIKATGLAPSNDREPEGRDP